MYTDNPSRNSNHCFITRHLPIIPNHLAKHSSFTTKDIRNSHIQSALVPSSQSSAYTTQVAVTHTGSCSAWFPHSLPIPPAVSCKIRESDIRLLQRRYMSNMTILLKMLHRQRRGGGGSWHLRHLIVVAKMLVNVTTPFHARDLDLGCIHVNGHLRTMHRSRHHIRLCFLLYGSIVRRRIPR